ncbi:MAG TPA: mannose-1-phosphate guanyltransferase [Planctomycetaceae bacterium]|nr:mannose-1-phosphate guanyltransferase [Planctomycetaceae bacterium]
MLHAVIMAGGSGTRFWPQSRKKTPKQLLSLAGRRTMIQQTLDPCSAWVSAENSWVVTNAVQADAVREQLPSLPAGNVLVEPAARNTAACVGLAALEILRRDPEGIMFVMPADHVIRTDEAFSRAALRAVSIVQQSPESLVLFGVIPTFPSTGYGYIERGTRLDTETPTLFQVQAFREKPQQAVAEQYLRDGRYFWNCGIFCWKAATIMNLLQQYESELAAGLREIDAAAETPDYPQVLAQKFPLLKSISIDYAVLERAQNVCVLEAPFQWDDVGSWLSLPRLNGSDAQGNTTDGLFAGVDTQGCIVRTSDDHLVATLGLRNLIIVHTPDATLVADAAQSERIKQLLDLLTEQQLQQYL